MMSQDAMDHLCWRGYSKKSKAAWNKQRIEKEVSADIENDRYVKNAIKASYLRKQLERKKLGLDNKRGKNDYEKNT